MSERVLVAVEGHVAHVRLNRPEKRNGLDSAMFDAIVEVGERLALDPSVRAVVLSGEGKAFCAGLDFASVLGAGPEAQARLLHRREGRPGNLAQRVAWVWTEVPVPVIAAIHGAAFGGGLQIALGADIRYVAHDAQLCVMEVRYGLIPDMGATKTLLRLVRPDVAKDLACSGRIVSGEEAVRLGLATFVSTDPVGDALAKARVIAGRSPHAIRAVKALFDAAPDLGAAESLALETQMQMPLLGSPNQIEALQATREKRDPNFQDPS